MTRKLFDPSEIPDELKQYFEEVAAKCGAPWRRVVERTGDAVNLEEGHRQKIRNNGVQNGGTQSVTLGVTHLIDRQTTGWQPTCKCQCDEVIPATVLDPFCGSGTTLRAAMALGRSAIGVDISDSYLGDLVPERTSNVQMELTL